jgi:hypothetical protein
MDLLLIFISIAGAVFAAVMLLLAFRTTRMERESDARVERLQALATGSVLFAPDGLAESDEVTDAPGPLPLFDPGVAPLRLQSHDQDLDLAWDAMIDDKAEPAETRDWAPDVQPPAHQFVLTVPATAASGHAFSFARTQRRSRT